MNWLDSHLQRHLHYHVGKLFQLDCRFEQTCSNEGELATPLCATYSASLK